ncbi:MAG: hypothetical protein WDA23_08340 [Gemmobacter sp.]
MSEVPQSESPRSEPFRSGPRPEPGPRPGTPPAQPETPVRRRKVFYIPGYDPFHPRRYRELYRKEAAAQSAVTGDRIELSPRAAGRRYGWHVRGVIEGVGTEAGFEVLVWSDIVRASMAQGVAATYLQLLRAAWVYFGSGAFFPLMRLRKGPLLATLYPVAMLLGQLALALVLGRGLMRGLALVVPLPLAAVAGLVLAVLVLRWFKRHDNRLFAYYLMHDFAFIARDHGRPPPELDARIAEFRAAIREALTPDTDEVLVVGHSSGAQIAVSVLAGLMREGLPERREGVRRPALSLLTLGQVIPMASFLPGAEQLRADLREMSAQDDIPWVDVSAPGDGCSFALCDPVAVTGVAPEGKRWPLVISAAFTQTLSPERWKALRWRFFRLHFQYLCAFDRPGDYDYFRITAGPRTLGARFAGRAPSKSRIEIPLNRHPGLAA